MSDEIKSTLNGDITEDERARLEADISSITPEGLLEMQRAIASLTDAVALPEAGGVVFTEFVNDNGSVINVTARASTASMAIDGLADAARKLRTLGYSIRRNRAPASSQLPSATVGTASEPARVSVSSPEDPGGERGTVDAGTAIEVTSYRRDATQGGKPYLRVFGGMYTKYGIPAYEQAIPKSANFDINSLQPGVPSSNVPEWMRKALVTSEKPLKVIRFL